MSSTTYVTDAATLGAGLLLARLVFGLLMVAHSGQKLFGWLGGYGLAGTAGYFEKLGFRPGKLFVITASVSEMASGFPPILASFPFSPDLPGAQNFGNSPVFEKGCEDFAKAARSLTGKLIGGGFTTDNGREKGRGFLGIKLKLGK